jgi:hypothetical protein
VKRLALAILLSGIALTSLAAAENGPEFLVVHVLNASGAEPMPAIEVELVPDNKLATTSITILKSATDSNGVARFPLGAISSRNFHIRYAERVYRSCSSSLFSRDAIMQHGAVAENSCQNHRVFSEIKAAPGTLVVFAEGGYSF